MHSIAKKNEIIAVKISYEIMELFIFSFFLNKLVLLLQAVFPFPIAFYLSYFYLWRSLSTYFLSYLLISVIPMYIYIHKILF